MLKKPKEALTFSKEAKEALLTLLKVMLLAQIRLSKETAVLSPLKETCKESETVCKVDLMEVKYLLLLMLNALTVFKEENPSTDSKEVSEMIMLLADCKLLAKVEMAGKVNRLMVSTSFKEPKEALSKTVNFSRFRAPVMVCTESAEKEFNKVALLIDKEP